MSRFVNLPLLRKAIEEAARAACLDAGLACPRVHVRIAVEPDARGERAVEVEATCGSPEHDDIDAFAARCALLELA
jgi:hypothetical protein